MGKWFLALTLVAMAAVPAIAQDTIALYLSDPVDGLQRWGNTPNGPFDIVAGMKTTSGSNYAEFVMDEITVLVPGMFKVATAKINNSPIDGGDNSLGEYAIDFGACVEAGVVEAVRVSYLDLSGVMPWDFFMEVRGFGPGDTSSSSFGGHPGYVDCEDTKRTLELEPWPGTPGCNVPPGALVLNSSQPLADWGCPWSSELTGFTAMKTRY